MSQSFKTIPTEPFEIRAARTYAEVGEHLHLDEPLSCEPLLSIVKRQLAELPEHQRAELRLHMAMAIEELNTLQDCLREEMERTGHSLRRASDHSDAASAYGRLYTM